MRWILFLSLASALVIYVVLGTGSKTDQLKNEDIEVKRDDTVDDVFQSENVAKVFIKDKRAPSPGFLFRRKYKIHRPYGHHGYHGYHGSRYYHRKRKEEYEEMEEGGFWGK